MAAKEMPNSALEPLSSLADIYALWRIHISKRAPYISAKELYTSAQEL